MEEQRTDKQREVIQSTGDKNKIPIIGLLIAIAGPAILWVTTVFYDYNSMSDTLARTIRCVAFGLPVVGLVIASLCLSKWRNDINGVFKAIALITAVMCNPFFLFIYYIVCYIFTAELAGQSWM